MEDQRAAKTKRKEKKNGTNLLLYGDEELGEVELQGQKGDEGRDTDESRYSEQLEEKEVDKSARWIRSKGKEE